MSERLTLFRSREAEDRTCSTCAYVKRFTPRPDEVARGLTLGCKYPNYEGYTSDEQPACGGGWWEPPPLKGG